MALIIYRGDETFDCVGMQPFAEPACGLCENHKPNRLFLVERKRINKGLALAGPFILQLYKGGYYLHHQTNDILYHAASVWLDLTRYRYIFTYGYKKQLHSINLTFSLEDFPHLAGFQYLKDLTLPKYNQKKIVERILDRTITYDQVTKGIQFDKMVKPRLEALICLKKVIESDFTLYTYRPHLYPFTTTIKADFLLSSHLDLTTFIFIIQTDFCKESICNYLCCSTFVQSERDYEFNQRSRTLLKKERIHIPTNTKTILFNKLTP